jgi:hypothetical protein
LSIVSLFVLFLIAVPALNSACFAFIKPSPPACGPPIS